MNRYLSRIVLNKEIKDNAPVLRWFTNIFMLSDKSLYIYNQKSSNPILSGCYIQNTQHFIQRIASYTIGMFILISLSLKMTAQCLFKRYTVALISATFFSNILILFVKQIYFYLNPLLVKSELSLMNKKELESALDIRKQIVSKTDYRVSSYYHQNDIFRNGYYIIEVPMDGNCLFHSLAAAYNLKNTEKLTATNMRKNIVDQMINVVVEKTIKVSEEKLKTYETAMSFGLFDMQHEITAISKLKPKFTDGINNFDVQQFKTYCELMRFPTIWGGQNEAFVYKDLYQVPLSIYCKGRDNDLKRLNFWGDPKDKNCVHLFFDSRKQHYNLIIPADQSYKPE